MAFDERFLISSFSFKSGSTRENQIRWIFFAFQSFSKRASIMMLSIWFEYIAFGLIFFFLFANLTGFTLLLLSFFSVRKNIKTQGLVESMKERFDVIAPGISLIAPAYNEEKTLSESVKSFLMLDYPNLEILIVNDGSSDSSLKVLIENFQLVPSERFYDHRLSSSKVRQFYESRSYSNLFVIDKENGGKADSINVGIGFASKPLFCAVDSDSILERDGLLKVVIPFIEEPETTLASGGTVRPVNGCRVEYGRVSEVRFSRNPLVLIQIVEYLRAFLFGRLGWNALGSTLIISGAFGLFRRDVVQEAGGYRRGSLGEDMELVVRLRRYATENEIPFRICFVPDPICWTEVPENIRSLSQQRDRWQQGLAESLLSNQKMFLNPRYRLAGLFAFPYFYIVELFGPIIEVLAYLMIGFGLWWGYVSLEIFLFFVIVNIVFGLFMSLAAVLIEENAFHKYPRFGQFLFLSLLACIEHLGYRQMTSLFRAKGLLRYFFGQSSWGKVDRQGFSG
ncbi:MAG: glycosyltransferase family 2 protein, partial [Bradymonadales bacterium]